jgi:hypothetical protein
MRVRLQANPSKTSLLDKHTREHSSQVVVKTTLEKSPTCGNKSTIFRQVSARFCQILVDQPALQSTAGKDKSNRSDNSYLSVTAVLGSKAVQRVGAAHGQFSKFYRHNNASNIARTLSSWIVLIIAYPQHTYILSGKFIKVCFVVNSYTFQKGKPSLFWHVLTLSQLKYTRIPRNSFFTISVQQLVHPKLAQQRLPIVWKIFIWRGW